MIGQFCRLYFTVWPAKLQLVSFPVHLIKVAEYRFLVLEDVIWKLCISGRPKLVCCKTN